MITKERLQQLIEQKSEIIRQFYDEYDECVRVKTIQLNPNTNYIQTLHFEEFEDMYTLIGKHETGDVNEGFLDDLFETDDLEEYNDFGNIVREEKLDLPLWSELQKIIKKGIMGFCTIKNFDNVHLGLKTNTNKETVIFIEKENKDIFAKTLTRENYNEAREICKELFLRGEGEK